MNNKKRIWIILVKILVFCLLIVCIKKTEIIIVPSENEMLDFQFGFITISTVFAGFSFTSLGMLLGMFSEPMMQKLKDTSIVTRKSQKLMRSIICFCVSGLLSLIFILGIDQYIILIPDYGKILVDYLFYLCILFLVIGIVFFIGSTVGVFQLISRVYGYNKKTYEKKSMQFEEDMKKAKERLKNRL